MNIKRFSAVLPAASAVELVRRSASRLFAAGLISAAILATFAASPAAADPLAEGQIICGDETNWSLVVNGIVVPMGSKPPGEICVNARFVVG